jgi:predicted DNA-binding transcriptional regulator AlpA
MTKPAADTLERERSDPINPVARIDMLDKLIPRKRLAEMLGKSEVTLIRWEKDGKGPPVTRIGRDVVYSVSSIEKWLKAQEHTC